MRVDGWWVEAERNGGMGLFCVRWRDALSCVLYMKRYRGPRQSIGQDVDLLARRARRAGTAAYRPA